MKISITGIKAREKAIRGMSYVAEAIKKTMGPFGLNFLLEKDNKITNDGFHISTALCPTIKDEFERRGALVAHEASSKTNEIVGDFTSGAWALTDAIVREAVRYLPQENSIKGKKTPGDIQNLITESQKVVLEKLAGMATPIEDKETLIKSALVSVENEHIAKLLGGMQYDLGPDGVIIAEEVNDNETTIEKVVGVRIDNGFGTSHMLTDQEKQTLELSDLNILLTNYVIDAKDILALRTSVITPLINQKKNGLIIIGRAFTQEAIKTCMQSLQSGFGIFPVNAPYVDQSEIMKDLEAVVGGRYIDIEESRLEDVYISDIGFAKRFVARRSDGVVTGVDNEEAQKRMTARAEKVKARLDGEKSHFMKRMLEGRIAQLSNGFAILKVGSPSLVDRKRLKDKCDDAVQAVRWAFRGGTVPGAGIALKRISESLPDDNILKRPLTVIHDEIMASAPEGWEVPEWVRDPYLVLKCGIEQACSFAGTFATVNGIVTEENKPKCNHESSAT